MHMQFELCQHVKYAYNGHSARPRYSPRLAKLRLTPLSYVFL